MKNLGDITKISGYNAPIVDVVIGGSPCQDLSVAGKRAGLAGERSGLYMEQIRIIKEMREHDKAGGRTGQFVRPRYMVWENVPGAFSSNHGKDFAAVLEEAVRIIEPEAPSVPVPEKGWPTSGCLMGDGWSVAWRVLDAQFWGVPQRRRRIALVADFGGQSAPEILFVRKSVSGNSDTGFRAWQRAARGTSPCAHATGFDGYNGQLTGDVSATLGVNCGMSPGRNGIVLNDQVGSRMDVTYEVTCTLWAESHHPPCVMDTPAVIPLEHHPTDSRIKIEESNAIQTLTSRMGTGGNNVPLVCDVGFFNCTEDIAPPMFSRAYKDPPIVKGTQKTIRRLTPLECERLQGFPCGWTDIGDWVDSKGKKRQTTDSARYKALGNSIALPPWKWVLKRLSAQYERDATMASLFDGIGGFPLIWEQLNGRGSCLWASEIDEFPIAVTKKRFREEQ